MSDLIQALKDNEKPFGLMMKSLSNDNEYNDMIEVFAEVGKNFQRYGNCIPGEWSKELYSLTRDYTSHGQAFRLRPDYAEKPKVVECEIVKNTGRLKYFREDIKIWEFINVAPSCPGFIGFDNEGMLWGRLYKWTQDGSFHTVIRRDRLDQYEVCDMSEAKVLFKGATK